ncbi:S-layer homology domain-containing protein [Domibacillus aminovorans]
MTLLFVQLLPIYSAAEGFLDVITNKEEINKLVESGIIRNYPDNTFKPNQIITREQGVAVSLTAGFIPAQSYTEELGLGLIMILCIVLIYIRSKFSYPLNELTYSASAVPTKKAI